MAQDIKGMKQQSGGWQLYTTGGQRLFPSGPARSLHDEFTEPRQPTATSQPTEPRYVIAHDVGLEMEVKSLRKEVAELRTMVASLIGGDDAVELREISDEDAKMEIRKYFADHHGEDIDAADLQEALGIDIETVIRICAELEQDGQIKGL